MGHQTNIQPKSPTRSTLEEIEDARLNVEKLTVLAQPHRQGDRGDMADAFGTFLRREFGRHEQDLMRRCWEAGQSYILKVARLRRAKGIPQRVIIQDETSSCGGDLDDETVREWESEIRQCENAMKCSGLTGFHAADNLVLEDVPPSESVYGPVKRAVIQLSVCLGFFVVEGRK